MTSCRARRMSKRRLESEDIAPSPYRVRRYGGDPLGQCRPGDPRGPCHLNPNPVKIAAATHMAGAYNLKKVLPRHVLQRRQPPQINLPAGSLE